jgi:hypothetical protein
MKKLIAIETKKYSTLIGAILDMYGRSAEIRINKTIVNGSEIEELRHAWCTNHSICRTRDFELRINDKPLYGFHDHPRELWADISEQKFLEQLRQKGFLRYRVLEIAEKVVKEGFLKRISKRLTTRLS